MSTLFVTGAGISANAGIATYRDGGSSWRDKELEAKSHANRYGNHLDELWDKHWGPTSEAMKSAQPTHAHKAIAEFQKTHESIIATQNIDDLHERAGSDNVAHVHGSMKIKCMRCKQPADSSGWHRRGAPVCRRCNKNKTRPDVVLFGENLNAKQFKGLEYFAKQIDTLVVVGSSLRVHPIAGLVMDTLSAHVHTVLINKGEASFSKSFTTVYDDDADEVIDEVLKLVK